jgi:hypothetical protein
VEALTPPAGTATPRRAILVHKQRVGIEDMSRMGCRFETAEPLSTGDVGILAVDIEGQAHVEFFRVSRITAVAGADGVYEAGVEFLPMPAEAASLHDIIGQFDRSDSK